MTAPLAGCPLLSPGHACHKTVQHMARWEGAGYSLGGETPPSNSNAPETGWPQERQAPVTLPEGISRSQLCLGLHKLVPGFSEAKYGYLQTPILELLPINRGKD